MQELRHIIPARGSLLFRLGEILTAAALAGILLFGFFVGYEYRKYARLIDQQLKAGPFSNTLNFYAAPRSVEPGERLDAGDLVNHIYKIGYREQPGAKAGWFVRTKHTIEVHPREGSEFASGAARLEFRNGKLARIVSLDGRKLGQYSFDPELIANISPDREKRRMVRFPEIPKTLVNAVLSAEDKRFFEHSGLDSLRMLKAAYVDLRDGRKQQGASTITMQLARNLWLDPAKSWRRKFHEVLIAAHLERKLSKQQIFEYYANEVYLGRRDTFSIHGFGQAAWDYFGRDIRQLTLSQSALLAGLVQRPGYFDPMRHPGRARERRNLVLRLMLANGFITEQEYRSAAAEPLGLSPGASRSADAPYFMDLLAAELQRRFQDRDVRIRNVYSTIDGDLQRAAVEAVRIGAAKLDKTLAKRMKDGARPEVALVAIDPRTGEIKALVGGRNYQESQLNRALARRPVGSTFKPFVYAAAFNTALSGGPTVFTPASIVDDERATFQFGDETYEPDNFKHASYGQMTVRQALARSSNVATVKVAEAVGYNRIADIARAAGLVTARGTPAVALGAYDATPLELAGAYTVFANQGAALKPTLVEEIRGLDGRVVYQHSPEQTKVLDPRVAYLVTNLLEGVMNYGTGAGARAAGFALPAAGKTGTARDGWFAGFTSELLTVVWVGFDDYRDLGLEGGKSALPIWTEFMKRAAKIPGYDSASPFQPPAGITTAEIDPETGQLASPNCAEVRNEYFIAGTEPLAYCDLHSHTAALAPQLQPVVR